MSREELDFASFYEASRDDCLRTVLASVGDMALLGESVSALKIAAIVFILLGVIGLNLADVTAG